MHSFVPELNNNVTGSAAQRPALPASGENQLTKRNHIPRLNQAQNAEPTTRPVHALLGAVDSKATFPLEKYQLRAGTLISQLIQFPGHHKYYRR
jgi:hypothetical protein